MDVFVLIEAAEATEVVTVAIFSVVVAIMIIEAEAIAEVAIVEAEVVVEMVIELLRVHQVIV